MPSLHTLTRRKALKHIGSATTILASGGIVGARTDTPSTDVVRLTGTIESPIGADQLRESVESLFQNYRQERGGEEPKPLVVSVPRSRNGSLVGAALQLTDTGRLRQYSGFASTPEDISRVQSRVADDTDTLFDTNRSQMISSSNGSWTIKNEGKLENYSDPYGQLVDDYVFSYHDDEPAYTYEERFQMTAGKLAYDSYYENDWGRNRQNWYDNGATMELEDYYPSNV